MVINSFEVNKNRIIVNGNKLGWVKLPDLFAYGTGDNTLQERFEMLYNDRVSKILNDEQCNNENNELDDNNIKHRKPKNKRYATRNNYKNINKSRNEELSFEEILSIIGYRIDIWAEFVYNKYKDFSIADLEDIKQTIYLELLRDINNRHDTKHYYCLNNIWHNLRYFILSLSDKLNIFKDYLKINIGPTDFDYMLRILEKSIAMFNTDDLISNFDEKSKILSSETGISLDRVKYIMILYDAITNIGNIENYSNITNSEEETTEDISIDAIFKDDVIQLLDEKLTDKEKLVITERFGIHNGRAKTLNEVGREFNVNGERIRQIEAKALRKLRYPSGAKK